MSTEYTGDIPGPDDIPRPWRSLAQDAYLANNLFNREQCDSLLFAINNPLGDVIEEGSPNSMQEYGRVVSDTMLEYWIDDLMNKRLKPYVEKLFPHLPSLEFAEHHAFMTSYSEEENHDLDLHVDASHITLNLCLTSNAQGADLVFTGSRCQQHVDGPPEPSRPVRFRAGDAVLHAGNQRHFVTALAGGGRKNLVIWYRLADEAFDHANSWLKSRCPDCS